ncbi:hypothetical protein VDIAB_100866 [Vibrio diabolicus]|nr:hypothetical protein VDIAB_100866 [Vibrio diabolicus]
MVEAFLEISPLWMYRKSMSKINLKNPEKIKALLLVPANNRYLTKMASETGGHFY